MASQTEYSMLFKLSAQLGKEFGATFSSAQKSLADTQKEIQALNKQQSDISAYQKQQQSVEATAKKLSDLQQQYDNIQREIQETEGFSSSLENKLIEKQRAIDKTSASLQTQTQKLGEMGDALRESGVDTDHLAEVSKKLADEMDKLSDEQERAAKEAKNYGEEGSGAFEAIGSALVAAGVQKALSEIINLYKEAVTEARQYADEILTVSAQYGVAANDLQSYYYAAELVDVSVDTITKSMAKNIKSMKAVQDGTKLSVEAYETLGVSVTNADGTLRDAETVYWEVIDALGAMENETQRDSLAQQILGRSALELNTLIKAGSGVMQGYAEEAEKAGYILSDEVLGTLGALDDAEQRQQNNLKALQNAVGNAFAPELTKLKELENELLSGLTNFISEHPVLVKSIMALTAEGALLLGVYTSYVAVKKGLNAIHAISTALKAAETAATVAQTTATEAETVAQVGLNAAMMANPIGLILGGVAALTVGIIALVEATKKETDATNQLTAKSKAEQAQIQKLNAEYKKTCKIYGETSYEAQSLKWEIEELEEDYEATKRTIGEFTEEIEASANEAEEARKKYAQIFDDIETKNLESSALIEKLSALSSTSNSAILNQAAIIPIVNKLNSEYSNLGIVFDSTTGKFNKTTKEMQDAAEAAKKAEEAEAAWAEYVDLIAKSPAQKELYDTAQGQYDAAKKVSDEAYKAYDDYTHTVGYYLELFSNSLAMSSGTGDIMGDYYAYYNILMREWATALDETNLHQGELNTAKEDYEETMRRIKEIEEKYGYNDNLDTSSESAEKLSKAVEAVRKSYLTAEAAASIYDISLERINSQVEAEEANETNFALAIQAVSEGFLTAEEAAEVYGTTVEKIEGYQQIQETITALDELVTKYNEAYEAAEKSINGQYALWDTAAVVNATDVGSINTALETQLSYWSDYNTDLDNLLARTDDVDGLAEVIASFADGSEDSVNAIAGMAAASDEELKTMVSNWQEVQAQQEEAAKSIAEIASGYSEELDNMLDDVSDSVDALNLDDEATAAAKATVEAYAQAIRDGTWDAVKAAEDMASLVANALSNIPVSPSNTGGVGTWSSYEDAAAGYSNIRTKHEFSRSNNADKQKYGTYDAYLKAMQEKYSAYASGTSYAEAGMALVGEEGPELVMMHGGETVLNAQETKARLGESVVITIAPSFSVTGNGDIEEQLHSFTDEIVEEVKSALEQSGIDSRRSVYA